MGLKLLFLIGLSLTVASCSGYSTSDADSLYTAITFGYNNLNRPSATVAVTVEFHLISINYLNTDSQEFSVSGWFNVYWTDSRFSWSPGSYSNIDEMFLDDSYCWTPKITVDNSVDSMKLLEDDSVVYRVTSGGEVGWSPSGVFTVSCSVDVTNFPYDSQTCYISVRSLSYDDTLLTLANNNNSSNNTDLLQENDDWDLLDSYYSEDNVTINSKTYSNVKYYYKLKRKSNYYVTNVIVPLILTSLMGVFIFLIAVDSGERLGFGVLILLAKCVLLVVLTEAIPSSGSSPLLVTYVVILLVLSVVEILITVINQRIYSTHERDRPLSGALRTVTMIFAVVTCTRSQDGRYDTENKMDLRIESPNTPDAKIHNISLRRTPSITPDSSLKKPNGEMRRAMTEHAWQRKNKGPRGDRVFTIKDLSDSIDKLCFVVFLLFWLIVTMVFLINISSSSS